MKKILLSIAAASLLGGCAQVKQLEATNNELVTANMQLEQDKLDTCAWLYEVSNMGMMVYLGDSRFFNQMSGEVFEYEDIGADCDAGIEGLRGALPSRVEAVESMLQEPQE